jgi:hypothetical protein
MKLIFPVGFKMAAQNERVFADGFRELGARRGGTIEFSEEYTSVINFFCTIVGKCQCHDASLSPPHQQRQNTN